MVGEAADGPEAVRVAKAMVPDVMLMDIRMPDMDGLEATRMITADPNLASVRVLVLTTFDLDAYVHEALCAGASGFLLKDTLPADLLAAVRVVAAGEALLAPSITRRLIEDFVKRPIDSTPDPRLDQITGREREVLIEAARGLSNAELSEKLFMSHATAKTHVSHLLTKFAVRDRAQLVVAAYETGLVARGRAKTSRLPTRASRVALAGGRRLRRRQPRRHGGVGPAGRSWSPRRPTAARSDGEREVDRPCATTPSFFPTGRSHRSRLIELGVRLRDAMLGKPGFRPTRASESDEMVSPYELRPDRVDPCMDPSENIAGTRLTCSNTECGCELHITKPCPHGSTYRCACGHELRAVPGN